MTNRPTPRAEHPTPEPTPTPAAALAPTPEPTPTPAAALAPTPEPTPTPKTTAEPTPTPTPKTTAAPTPTHETAPTPETTAALAPTPETAPTPEPAAIAPTPEPTAIQSSRAQRRAPPRSEPDDPAKRYDAVPPMAAALTAELADAARRHDAVPPKAAEATAELRKREANRARAPLSGAPRIYLHTQPAGAEVWLLGQLRGTSPMSLDLDGPAEVTLRHPEHHTTHVTLAPADGSRWLSVPLDPR